MRYTKSTLLTTLLSLLFVSSVCMAETFSETVKLQIDDEMIDLQLTGNAIRQKYLIKVYEVAHYMQNPPALKGVEAIHQLLNDTQNVKQLTLVWMRGVDGKRIKQGYDETFNAILGDRVNHFLPQIKKFLSFFKKGAAMKDLHVIRWMPKGKIIVEINGSLAGEIVNPEFARAVWEIWFGPNAIVESEELVSRL